MRPPARKSRPHIEESFGGDKASGRARDGFRRPTRVQIERKVDLAVDERLMTDDY